MIINMAVNATEEQIDHVVKRIQECGFQAHLIRGEERTVIGIVGTSAYIAVKKGKDLDLPAQTGMLVRMDSAVALPANLLHNAAYTSSGK